MEQAATVCKTITISATAAQVWAALTQPALLTQWMAETEVKVEATWQVGSSLLFSGQLHGIDYINKGTIVACEVEKYLAYTYWSSLSGIADSPENYTLLAFTLRAGDTGTSLQVTQSNFLLETTFKHTNFYWNGALKKLKDLVEKPSPLGQPR